MLACTAAVRVGAQNSAAAVVPAQSVVSRSGASDDRGSDALVAFVEKAQKAADRYRSRDEAVRQGFRRLGMDFPSMGEHWVSPGKVLSGRFDPADPAMLTYATIRGTVTLVGIVYAIPLSPGENPPRLPDGVNHWHEHNGTVEEESMLPEHHSRDPESPGTRLAILHLWLDAPNPAGMFAADNWSLPFARLGLQAPADLVKHEAAARAVSLLTGGDRFFLNLARQASPTGRLDADQEVAVAAAQAAVQQLMAARGSAPILSDAALNELDSIWNALARRVRLHGSANPD